MFTNDKGSTIKIKPKPHDSIEVVKQLDIDKNCVTRDLRLLSLAPDLQKLAAEGREPETLSLARLREPFPEDWEEQRKKFLTDLTSY